MIRHPFGFAGLILNTAGALGLLKYTADPDAGAVLSHDQLQSLRSVNRALRWPYTRKVWAYQACLIALALGFVLQLADLLIA